MPAPSDDERLVPVAALEGDDGVLDWDDSAGLGRGRRGGRRAGPGRGRRGRNPRTAARRRAGPGAVRHRPGRHGDPLVHRRPRAEHAARARGPRPLLDVRVPGPAGRPAGPGLRRLRQRVRARRRPGRVAGPRLRGAFGGRRRRRRATACRCRSSTSSATTWSTRPASRWPTRSSSPWITRLGRSRDDGSDDDGTEDAGRAMKAAWTRRIRRRSRRPRTRWRPGARPPLRGAAPRPLEPGHEGQAEHPDARAGDRDPDPPAVGRGQVAVHDQEDDQRDGPAAGDNGGDQLVVALQRRGDRQAAAGHRLRLAHPGRWPVGRAARPGRPAGGRPGSRASGCYVLSRPRGLAGASAGWRMAARS